MPRLISLHLRLSLLTALLAFVVADALAPMPGAPLNAISDLLELRPSILDVESNTDLEA